MNREEQEKNLWLLFLQARCAGLGEGPYTHRITIIDKVREHQVAPIIEKEIGAPYRCKACGEYCHTTLQHKCKEKQ